jgi:TonB family protein
MIPLADLIVRSTLVIVATLVAWAALRGQSAALRHWLLATGILAAVAVAPLGALLPSWQVPAWDRPEPSTTAPLPTAAAPIVEGPIPSVVVTAVAPEANPLPWSALLPVVWAFGLTMNAGVIFVGFVRLSRITRAAAVVIEPRWIAAAERIARSYGLAAAPPLLRTSTPDLLATWGRRRARVLLPADADGWSDARIAIVLAHELAHIRRGDWAVHIAADVVRAIFWFNPLFWLACARLRRESEQACDDVVIGAGVAPASYAAQLIDLARTCRRGSTAWAAAMPMARPSTLEWRIAAMLNPTLIRRRPARLTLAATLAMVVIVAAASATFRTSAQSGPLPLTGAVYDTTGAVLPQVELTLTDAQHVVSHETTTDGAGRFEFPLLAAGRYELTTKLNGFNSLKQEFELQNERDWERAITLQVGTLVETISVRAQRPTSMPAAAAGAVPVRVGGNIRVPHKLVDVKPIYPESMRELGLEGRVPLEALIGMDGQVMVVRVTSAQVHPDFAKAAIDAVREWKFSPTLLNGVAVEVLMTVSVQFSLSD